MNVHPSDTTRARNVRTAALELKVAQNDFNNVARNQYHTVKQWDAAEAHAERCEAVLLAALDSVGVDKATVALLREVLA